MNFQNQIDQSIDPPEIKQKIGYRAKPVWIRKLRRKTDIKAQTLFL